MKTKVLSVFMAVTVLVAGFGISAVGQKSRPEAPVTASDLDKGGTPLSGKRVFYQLLPEECNFECNGLNSKVPAIISFNDRGVRDERGRRTVSLFIMRPARWGGSFDKDFVAKDSGRDAGSWDTVQPGDLID